MKVFEQALRNLGVSQFSVEGEIDTPESYSTKVTVIASDVGKPEWTKMVDEIERIKQERKWSDLREQRNSLLQSSDFSQLPDAPVNRDEWATYRQALRDLPSTVDINNPVYPTKPIGG
jgi:hypothetical protein